MDEKNKMKKKSYPEPIKGTLGAPFFGPTNHERDAQNPDMLIPPPTDYGHIPNLKWSFSDSHMRLYEGGWTREATMRELPSSPTLAGVMMHLTAGGIREMHWHHASEWAYMLKGTARITAVDENGCAFQDDLQEGDLWFFPAGIPHSIQGLADDGCEFLLVFDDGYFSEDETFLLTDWLAHTPPEILAKNFGVAEAAFARIPQHELYIFQSKVPPLLSKDRVEGNGSVPKNFSYKMREQKPLVMKSGTVRIVDSHNFPASNTVAAALVEIEPGGLRELHWHPNADEWQFYISGQARMTVFAPRSNARTFNFQAGDVGAVPSRMPHYIENIGSTTLRFLELFKSDHFADVSLSQWLVFTPFELVQAHLNIEKTVLAQVSKSKKPIVP